MSLDLVREVVKVNKVVNDKTTQIIVENDIIVPDTKPDVAQILSAEAEVYTTGVEIDAKDENTLVKGIIRYKILYKPEDSDTSIKSINTGIPFSHKMDTPGMVEGVRSIIKWIPEHVECTISNGRKINVKSILQLNRTVIIEDEHVLVSDLRDNESAQILRDSMDITRYIGSNESVYTVSDSLEIPAGSPPIREILRNDVKIVNKDFSISEDRVTVSGELNITTLYLGDDNDLSVRFIEHSIPFSQTVEMRGITEEASCEVDYEVRDYNFELEEDSDGEYRILKGDIEICANVWANEKINIDYLVDAYGLRSQLNIEKGKIVFDDRIFAGNSQIITKEIVSIGDDNPEIDEILNVYSIPVLSDYRILEDKIELEGFVTSNINYFSNDNAQGLSCYRATIPINHIVEIKGIKPNMNCKPELFIEYINYSLISSKDVEIKLVLNVDCKVYNTVERDIIEKITEEPLDENARSDRRPSIVMYFVQPEDTYWEIAKRYRTTINEIQRVNGLSDEDAIEPGMQILITRKAQ